MKLHLTFKKTIAISSFASLLALNTLSAEMDLGMGKATGTEMNSGTGTGKGTEKDSGTGTSEYVIFTPPEGWRFADTSMLPPSVKTMVIGKGASEFPPSINLGTENYTGTLKQYLKRIKEINQSQGAEWKDLGMIRTEAGDASLSQVDTKTQWGDVRMMHVILLKDGTVYILTAASLKDEFPSFYKDLFNSLRSLRFDKRTTTAASQNP